MKKNILSSFLFTTLCLFHTYSTHSSYPDTEHDPEMLGIELSKAVHRNDEDQVRKLLIQGALLDHQLCGDGSPLTLAAGNGNTTIVSLLLEAQANPNFQHRDLWTALAYAAYRGQSGTVSQLIEAGARLDKKIFRRNPFEGTLEDVYGTHNRRPSGASSWGLPRYWNSTALHCAAQNGHDQVVKLLLEAGAHAERHDGYKRTPLNVATLYHHKTTVNILINAGAELNTRDREKNTPLHYAVLTNNHALIRMLARAGACLNKKNGREETPLMLATHEHNQHVVRILLKHGAHLPPGEILDTDERITIHFSDFPNVRRGQMLRRFIEKIEREYDVPRDITRLICEIADTPPEQMPPAPLATSAHSTHRNQKACCIIL